MRVRRQQLDVAADRGTFRPVGTVSLVGAMELITGAIVTAREQALSQLLVNATGLDGFDPPTLGERYFFISTWALAAGGTVRLALVVRSEMIDPNRFGVTVAANRGLVSNVFASEPEAEAWLATLE